MSRFAMEAFNQILLQYPPFVVGGVGATAIAAGGALIYRIATRKKPTHVKVNCWFCNQDTVVPYGNRNCWDCPYCEQYNGFQENGDYNKPIPAQYMEHLNHGISAGVPESPKTLQWVNCQMLLCKKCNNNQTLKMKQLASFIPRDNENYDEEIEVYKHHLEQTYKLCRPCQTAVEYYIKHQNRQLRALLFNHQLRRSRDADKALIKNTYSLTTPAWLILLRVLAFLACAFLVAVALSGSGDVASSISQTLSRGVNQPKNPLQNDSESKAEEGSMMWDDLVALLPEKVVENARLVWQCGSDHQMAVASFGLLTCITGVLMAGPVRLRRIDVVAAVLWLLVICFYLAECYLKTDITDWMESVKLGITSLCCLVGFAAAVATSKSQSQRRARGHRYLSGSSPGPYYTNHCPSLSAPVSASSTFIPTPPPNLSQLLIRQQIHRTRKASPSSLPGRLNRALSLGTIPSLARADSGFLFSGSRPSSQCKDSPPSVDYYSLKSGSRPSSPGPSPTPSVAGSVTSTSSSARQRRPLISPARLNISGQKLRLFSSPLEPLSLAPPPPFLSEQSHVNSSGFLPDAPHLHSQNHGSLIDEGSVFEHVEKRMGSSSGSSDCHVDTTTGNGTESKPGWKGFLGLMLWPGLLFASLSINLTFIGFYLYYNWR
ncbi:transmembrane protein 201-like isoform X1 [Carassius auratus]|uniref:Transmembrane protein 201-like isoform X1 n=1 Tax=Carassius auratus TaxID=7957 RepID=A0A6P6J649_CARAU|nr:transmembrane protein 201-like isoform X1 [Carassius auratus]